MHSKKAKKEREQLQMHEKREIKIPGGEPWKEGDSCSFEASGKATQYLGSEISTLQ